MSVGIALFCSVRSSDFIDPFKHGYHDLFVELRTLSEIDLTAEIFHLEHFRSSFRRESDDLWCVDLGESIVIKKFPHGFFHKCGYFEYFHISWMSEDHHLVIMDSLPISMDFVLGDIYRTRINNFSEYIHATLL